MTSREIAAYLAGARFGHLYLSWPTAVAEPKEWVAANLAQADALVLCSLGARSFWRWFDIGWEHAVFGGHW